jgi:hypothetical protein
MVLSIGFRDMTTDEFIALIDGRKKLTKLKLSQFERSQGFRFPEEYREFLLRCNGGYVGGAETFQPKLKRGSRNAYSDVVINTIGGLDRRHGNLGKESSLHAAFLPSSLVWIMDDLAGNAVCIGVTGKDTGRFYFWDHEYDLASVKSRWTQVTRIANDFASLLDGMVIDE